VLSLLALCACLLAAAMLLGSATASARTAGAGGAVVTSPQSDKLLTSFSFQGLSPAAVGTIDQTAHTVAVTVPTGTDVTALVATFTTSPSDLVVYVQPRHYPQASGLTPHDFSSPVTYEVQAEDESTQDYVVTVTVGARAASTIAANGGSAQTATVGTAVGTAPSVIVKDAGGNPVAGTSVTFAVASGGGAITGASATTNASGIAAVGSWTLGTVAGANTLTATAGGLSGSPVTFTATGSVGIPTQEVIETAPDGSAVPIGARSVAVGSSFKLYVNACDQYGNFFANVHGIPDWSLTGMTGGVTGGDLVTATVAEPNYATFTGHLRGTCVVRVVVGSGSNHPYSAETGTITVTGGARLALKLTGGTSIGARYEFNRNASVGMLGYNFTFPRTTTTYARSRVKLTVHKIKAGVGFRFASRGTTASRWAMVKTVVRRSNARGAFRWTFKPGSKGIYRVRASVRKTTKHAGFKTKWIVFKVK
jgi:hypothetical protein